MTYLILAIVELIVLGAIAYQLFKEHRQLKFAYKVLEGKQAVIDALRVERTAHLATIQSQQRELRAANDNIRSLSKTEKPREQVKPFVVGVQPIYDNNGFPTTQLAFRNTKLL